MLGFAQLEAQARQRQLTISAGLAPPALAHAPNLPKGTATLLLLSPDEPAFWPRFITSAEFNDGAQDPMDRWSNRVISEWANAIGAQPLFPFSGPPYHPFVQWALASGHAHGSPLGMLVHAKAGLFLSFRGAIALPYEIKLPSPTSRPCDTCKDQPCLTACPVSAIGRDVYDTVTCRTYLKTNTTNDCLTSGCRARRSCPSGKKHGRLDAHSAYHMTHFL